MFSRLSHFLCLFWLTPGLANAQDTGAETAPSIEGTFHLRMRVGTAAQVPVLGPIFIRTTTDLLVRVEKDGDKLKQIQETCAVYTKPDRAIARTVLPQPFIDSLPIKSYPVGLEKKGERWVYSADLGQLHVGYDPVKAGGKMPEKKSDPSIYDWDKDGVPGASIYVDIPVIGNVRVYMVQTNHTHLRGRVMSDDRIEGRTNMVLIDQHTIGADNFLFARSAEIRPAGGYDDFEMVRIKPGSTCESVKERRPTEQGAPLP